MVEKMILIPENLMHQHEEIERRKTVYPTLMRIETDISNILDSQLHSDFEKTAILNQLQQRYKAIEGTKESTRLKLQSEENDKQMNSDTVFSEIMNSLSKTKKPKAAQILSSIKSNENIINWDNRKRLVIDGNPVENTNIIDLVKILVNKPKKTEKPHGLDIFTEYLNRIGVSVKQSPKIPAQGRKNHSPNVLASARKLYAKKSDQLAERAVKKRKLTQWTEE